MIVSYLVLVVKESNGRVKLCDRIDIILPLWHRSDSILSHRGHITAHLMRVNLSVVVFFIIKVESPAARRSNLIKIVDNFIRSEFAGTFLRRTKCLIDYLTRARETLLLFSVSITDLDWRSHKDALCSSRQLVL
jgi:hypothetical protein